MTVEQFNYVYMVITTIRKDSHPGSLFVTRQLKINESYITFLLAPFDGCPLSLPVAPLPFVSTEVTEGLHHHNVSMVDCIIISG